MIKKMKNKKELRRIKRHYRIRKNAFGTKTMPRMSVHKSNRNLYIQFIDDVSNVTLLSVSSNEKNFKKEYPRGTNVESAKKLGGYVSREAKKKGIEKVIFDRGGNLYHGRIKALAEASREAGLKF